MSLTVCIVGAGAAGLTAIKSCIEHNLTPTCFECTNVIGGIWSTNVTKHTITNSSKEHSAFSDFPPPSEYPLFMNQSHVLGYLEAYAQHFNLTHFINFGHRVTCIKQNDCQSTRKKWQVTILAIQSNITTISDFDAVLMCTGNNHEPFIPDIPGLRDTFTGSIIHSSNLFDHPGKQNGHQDEDDEDADHLHHPKSTPRPIGPRDRVIVIGGANSAGDAAVFCAERTNEPVVILVKTLPWVIPRRGPSGRPFDETVNCRSTRAKLSVIPSRFLTNYLGQWLIEYMFFDHKLYCGGNKPCHGIFDDQCMINDVLPLKILTGNVKMLQFKSIVQFGNRCLDIVIGDGTKITSIPCDKVIFATGFNSQLSQRNILGYLLGDMADGCQGKLNRIEKQKSKYPLYKHMYIPEIGHTFALIGSVSPLGPMFPIVELQARWACGLIATRGLGNSDLRPLPPLSSMKSIIVKDLQNQPRASGKVNLVDWLHYMDDIANQLSSCPSFVSLLVADPLAWYHTFFGPCYSYQFRLTGHGNCTDSPPKDTSSDGDQPTLLGQLKSKLTDSISIIAPRKPPARTKGQVQANKLTLQRTIFRQMSPRIALLSAKNRIEDAFRYHNLDKM